MASAGVSGESPAASAAWSGFFCLREGERSELGSGRTAEQEEATLDGRGDSKPVQIGRDDSTRMSLWGAGVLETKPRAWLDSPLLKR